MTSGRDDFSQHDQKHSGLFGRINSVTNVRGHADNRAWPGGDGDTTDRECQRAFEDHDEGIERRRVFAQSLPGIEREQRQAAGAGLG